MKKLKNFLRFVIISIVVFVFWISFGYVLFKNVWNFDISSSKSYSIIYNYWEQGGVFNTFRDCSLGMFLFAWPILWLVLSYKLYKYGLTKFLLRPIIAIYHRLTKPKDTETPHVSIKNLGGKDLTLNEIIAAKIEAKGEKTTSKYTSIDIRKQIANKIEESAKQ